MTIAFGLVWFACIVGRPAVDYDSAQLLESTADPSMHDRSGELMASGSAIRGSRVGAGPMGEAERGEPAPRQRITYWCAQGHESRPSFADEADPPDVWDCPRCGMPAGQDSRPRRGAQERAVQDPPGLREGAPLRRRRRGDPGRGARQAARREPSRYRRCWAAADQVQQACSMAVDERLRRPASSKSATTWPYSIADSSRGRRTSVCVAIACRARRGPIVTGQHLREARRPLPASPLAWC